MKGINKLQNYYELLIAMVSVFFSSLIINIIMKKGTSFDYLLITMADLKRTISIPVISAFLIIFLKRIKQIAVLIVFMKLFNPDIVNNLSIVILSSFYGVLMSVQAYAGGIYMVGIFLVSILPQYILYYMCVDLTYKFYKGKVFNKNKAKFFCTIIMLTVIGTFLEENFLRFFLK